jgi:hypothetical protein
MAIFEKMHAAVANNDADAYLAVYGGGFHREAQRFKRSGFRRLCQALTGTPRPGIGSRGICAG